MKFKEIARRITGFNVPCFGVSWNPPEPEANVAKRVLAFLEDRRVLFNPISFEVPNQCVKSVIEIRKALTEEIGQLSDGLELKEHLRGIRAACRKFLDYMQPNKTSRKNSRSYYQGHFGYEFTVNLGELRATIGLHIAAIAVMYGIDIEGELAMTLPASVEGED